MSEHEKAQKQQQKNDLAWRFLRYRHSNVTVLLAFFRLPTRHASTFSLPDSTLQIGRLEDTVSVRACPTARSLALRAGRTSNASDEEALRIRCSLPLCLSCLPLLAVTRFFFLPLSLHSPPPPLLVAVPPIRQFARALAACNLKRNDTSDLRSPALSARALAAASVARQLSVVHSARQSALPCSPPLTLPLHSPLLLSTSWSRVAVPPRLCDHRWPKSSDSNDHPP